MKLGIPLTCFAIACLPTAFPSDYIDFFGDGDILSRGMHIAAPHTVSNPGELLTYSGNQEFTWNEKTGQLISAGPARELLFNPRERPIDSEEANVVAYVDDEECLIILERSSGRLLARHDFDTINQDYIVHALDHIPGSQLIWVKTGLKRNDDSFFQVDSNQFYLIQTGTGQIVRSFNRGGSTNIAFFPVPHSETILALQMNARFSGSLPTGISPEFSSPFRQVFSIHAIDTSTGQDLIPPIATTANAPFQGAAIPTKDFSFVYGILNPTTLTKINLQTLDTTSSSIPQVTNLSNLTLHNDRLSYLNTETTSFFSPKTLKTLNAETLAEISTLTSLNAADDTIIHSYAPIGDNQHLALSNRQSDVEIWNYETGAYVRDIGNASGILLSWASSPDRKKLLTLSTEQGTRYIKVWDIANANLLLEKTPPNTSPTSTAGIFTGDSQRILINNEKGNLAAFNISNGSQAYQIPNKGGRATALAYYDDGNRKLIIHHDGTIEKFLDDQLVSDFQLQELPTVIHQIHPTDGLLIYYSDRKIKTYHPATDQIEEIWTSPPPEGLPVDDPLFNTFNMPDQVILDRATQRLVIFRKSSSFALPRPPRIPGIPFPGIPSLPNSSIQILDLTDLSEVAAPEPAPIEQLVYDKPNQRLIALHRDSGKIDLIDINDGSLKKSFEWPALVGGITHYAQGDELIILSQKQLHRLDSDTGDLIQSYPIQLRMIPYFPFENRLSISADDRVLSINGSIDSKFFQLPEFREMNSLHGAFALSLPSNKFSLVLAPDSSGCLSIDLLGSARSWKFRTGNPVKADLDSLDATGLLITSGIKTGHRYTLHESEDMKTWHSAPIFLKPELRPLNFHISPQTGHPRFCRIIEYPPPLPTVSSSQ